MCNSGFSEGMWKHRGAVLTVTNLDILREIERTEEEKPVELKAAKEMIDRKEQSEMT